MTSDPTEGARRALVSKLNDEAGVRSVLEQRWGQVWNTEELGRDFEVLGFLAPFVHVRRRSDGVEGTLSFQHRPRFYFAFDPAR